jgi:hypothetical protein
MNVQMQNHLKVGSIFLIALGMLTIPADLPYGSYIAAITSLLGVIGYALAHYLADPATATADLNTAIQGVANTINSVRNAAGQQQAIDPTVLTADITNMVSQLVTKYSQAQSQAANPQPATNQ